jgi:hypothetical protein
VGQSAGKLAPIGSGSFLTVVLLKILPAATFIDICAANGTLAVTMNPDNPRLLTTPVTTD